MATTSGPPSTIPIQPRRSWAGPDEVRCAERGGAATPERPLRTVTVRDAMRIGDILVRDASLPDPRPGDILSLFSTGAYCFAMASNYNRVPRPALVVVKGGKARLSVRRETYEDLFSREQ